jgi:hypothetical protein
MLAANDKFSSIGDAVKNIIDGYPEGYEFHGNELRKDVITVYPKAKRCYVDTVLRKMRLYRRHNVECVSITKSLYKRV